MRKVLVIEYSKQADPSTTRAAHLRNRCQWYQSLEMLSEASLMVEFEQLGSRRQLNQRF